MKDRGERAVTPVVGIVLLVAITLVLSAVVSYGLLGSGFLGGLTASATPVTAIDVDADETGLSVNHVAGGTFPVSELVLVVNSETGFERVPFTALGTADADEEFAAGDTYVYSGSLSGYADVRVVHEPSNAVLYRGTTRLAGSTGPLPGLDFESATVSSYAPSRSVPQDVDGTVRTNGNELSMTGNTWKAVANPYTVTADTVVTFEFRSTAEGEIHAVGLLDAAQFREDRFFRLAGTQNWGRDAYDGYDVGDGWVRYEIPVGQYYQGDVDSIVFANDHDVSTPTATSAYRNVQLYETD